MSLLVLVTPLFFYAGAAAGQERPIVAVFDIKSEVRGWGPSRMRRFTDVLATFLGENGFQVVPRSQVKARLREAKKESYRNCYDSSCQIELGRELAAQKVLRGTITRIGGTCRLLLDLYDLKKAVSEKSVSFPHKCTEKDTLRVLKRAAVKLSMSLGA
ncbi:MAG: hypothetical protein D6806_18535, partial [Deltaproteobacteria bacterium]